MWLLLLACGGLPPEGRAARDGLAEALESRDPDRVGPAVKAAAAWKGEDPELDLLLGDALANVLMRPMQGLLLLDAHPQPDDPDWVRARNDAVLRSGDRDEMARLPEAAGLDLDQPLIDQAIERARDDPSVGWSDVARALADCALFDARPKVGRQQVDVAAPVDLPRAAKRLGALQVVMGRINLPSDPDPLSGRGLWACKSGRLIGGDTLPAPLPRTLVLGARFPTGSIYLDIQRQRSGPVVFAAAGTWHGSGQTVVDGAGDLLRAAEGALPGGSAATSDGARGGAAPAGPADAASHK